MHDPSTLIGDLRWPWGRRQSIISLWHEDPETDGTDDSCGWFMRARHGDPIVLKRIVDDFSFEWDATHGGWFDAEGRPRLSVSAITLDMFHKAAWAHFRRNRRRVQRFMRRHLVDILLFAENIDSLQPYIVSRYGIEPREDRIRECAGIVYGCVLRWSQPWWRHPRWHVHHWRIQFHPWERLRRRLPRLFSDGRQAGGGSRRGQGRRP